MRKLAEWEYGIETGSIGVRHDYEYFHLVAVPVYRCASGAARSKAERRLLHAQLGTCFVQTIAALFGVLQLPADFSPLVGHGYAIHASAITCGGETRVV